MKLDNWLAKATQEVTYRVKVPVEALAAETPSRTARVSVTRRCLEEAEGKSPAFNERPVQLWDVYCGVFTLKPVA